MYKDKARQREANRMASQRRRDKGMTQGMTKEGMTPQGMTCVGKPCYPRVSDQEFTKLLSKAGPGFGPVSKPGDEDYVPRCETTRTYMKDVGDACGLVGEWLMTPENSKNSGGPVPKVPKPPRGAGLTKS